MFQLSSFYCIAIQNQHNNGRPGDPRSQLDFRPKACQSSLALPITNIIGFRVPLKGSIRAAIRAIVRI